MLRKIFLLLLVLSCCALTWPDKSNKNDITTDMKTYVSQDDHYSIKYPATWDSFDRGKGVVVFKNHADKTGYPLMVNIQTLYTKKGGGKYATVKDLMDDFYSQVPMHVEQAKFVERSSIVLTEPDGTKIYGEQTVLTFVMNNHTLKQWQVMLMNQNGKIFQAFAYRAPIEFFEANKSTAQAMFNSWVVN